MGNLATIGLGAIQLLSGDITGSGHKEAGLKYQAATPIEVITKDERSPEAKGQDMADDLFKAIGLNRNGSILASKYKTVEELQKLKELVIEATSEAGTKKEIPQELANSLSEAKKEGVREVFLAEIKDREKFLVNGEILKQLLGKDYNRFALEIEKAREPKTEQDVIDICDECIKNATSGRANFAKEWEAKITQLAKDNVDVKFKNIPAFIDIGKKKIKDAFVSFVKEFK